MKNLKVAQKLILSFLIVAFLTAAVGVVGIVAVLKLTNSATLLNDRATIGMSANGMKANLYAIRNILRGGVVECLVYNDQDAANKLLDSLPGYVDDSSKKFEEMTNAAKTDTTKEMLKKIEDARGEFARVRDLYEAEVRKVNTNEEAIRKLMDDFGVASEPYANAIDECVDAMDKLTTEASDQAQSLSKTILILIIAVALLAVIVAIIFAIYISNLISKPLQDMTKAIRQAGEQGNLEFKTEEIANLRKIAEGKDEVAQSVGAFAGMMSKFIEYGKAVQSIGDQDLSVEVSTLGKEDTFGNAIEAMVGSLNETFGEIQGATEQVSSGSKQIADGAQSLAQGSTQQAAAVEELSASIAEIANKTKDNAALATKAAGLAEAAKNSAEKGSQQMSEMVTAVQEINDASSNIQKVIKVIDDIAFQTNILALNAAVEAARAGQHGKGFAVVAEEVRNLAAKSAEAAKDTGVLISSSMEKAQFGSKIAQETAVSLEEILSASDEQAKLVGNIASASEEQAEAISQINNGIDQVAQVVQQNSATSEESAATAEELSSQSAALESLISQFQLKGASGRGGHRHHLPSAPASRPAASQRTLAMPPKGASSGSYTEASDYGKY